MIHSIPDFSSVPFIEDLGFNRIVGILDNDKSHLINNLSTDFPDFHFFAIPADDVRTKPARKATSEKIGLLDSTGSLDSQYENEIKNLFFNANEYLAQ